MITVGNQPQVVAHRGIRTQADWNELAPENSLPAFRQAAMRGADIELDVIASTDGQLFVHHDDATGRLFHSMQAKQPFQDLSSQDVLKLKFNPFGHEVTVHNMLGDATYRTAVQYLHTEVPHLEQVLDEIWRLNPGTHVYIEAKTHNQDVKSGKNNRLEEHLVALIQQKNLYNKVTVISFSPLSLKQVKKLDNRIHTGLDIDLEKWGILSQQSVFLKGLVYWAKRVLGVDVILPNMANTSANLVNIAHQANLRVAPWVGSETVEEERQAFPRLLKLGVDGLVTNTVDSLQALLASEKPAK